MHSQFSAVIAAERSVELRRAAAATRPGRESVSRTPALAVIRRYFGTCGQAESRHFVGRVGELAELELAVREVTRRSAHARPARR